MMQSLGFLLIASLENLSATNLPGLKAGEVLVKRQERALWVKSRSAWVMKNLEGGNLGAHDFCF